MVSTVEALATEPSSSLRIILIDQLDSEDGSGEQSRKRLSIFYWQLQKESYHKYTASVTISGKRQGCAVGIARLRKFSEKL